MPTSPKTFKAGDHVGGGKVRLSARQRGYTSAWAKASLLYRRLHPLCEYCDAGAFGEPGRASLTTRVDHLYPQRRFAGVFWLRELWVASCDDCDGRKQALEHGTVADLDALARRIGRPTLAELLADA